MSSLLYLFTQHFKFQPFVLGLLQFLLRSRKRVRGGNEFLAILLVQIGVVNVPLLFGDFGLQPGDGFRQCFQRVLFVEIEPALCRAGRRAG